MNLLKAKIITHKLRFNFDQNLGDLVPSSIKLYHSASKSLGFLRYSDASSYS